MARAPDLGMDTLPPPSQHPPARHPSSESERPTRLLVENADARRRREKVSPLEARETTTRSVPEVARTLVWRLTPVWVPDYGTGYQTFVDCDVVARDEAGAWVQVRQPRTPPRSPRALLEEVLGQTDATYLALTEEGIAWDSFHVARLVGLLEEDSGLAAISGPLCVVDQGGESVTLGPPSHAAIVLRLLAGDGDAFPWEPMVIRVEALRQALRFLPDVPEEVFFPFALPLALAHVGRLLNHVQGTVSRWSPRRGWRADRLEGIVAALTPALVSGSSPKIALLSPALPLPQDRLLRAFRSAETSLSITEMAKALSRVARSLSFRPGAFLSALSTAQAARRAEREAEERLREVLAYPERVRIPAPFSEGVYRRRS